ncbi:MAG: malonyl-ACP O-methyltransferase BioC [Betaproteobacteria bacterium]|nr:malonyl-ACP O-methyltransferase BioC [Betaproteobacteria bacterium]
MADDLYRIDKTRARVSFGRAADTYDAAAILQRQVCQEMIDRLDLVKLSPHVVLDAGCGTGIASRTLQNRFEQSLVVSLDFAYPMLQKTREVRMGQGILPQLKSLLGCNRPSLLCADIEALPLVTGSAGLIWSNLAIQWCHDLDVALQEFHRVLQPEGLLMFSTFGPDTLRELRVAADVASGNEYTSVSRFIDMHDIGDALVRAGFSAPVLDVERFTLTYDDAKSVMRDLKNIGAHNATDGRARGLMGRSYFSKLEAAYEQFRQDGKLPATFEVVYAHAWRGENPLALDAGLSPVHFKPRNRQP